jgi:hypothetical protein
MDAFLLSTGMLLPRRVFLILFHYITPPFLLGELVINTDSAQYEERKGTLKDSDDGVCCTEL